MTDEELDEIAQRRLRALLDSLAQRRREYEDSPEFAQLFNAVFFPEQVES